MNISQVVKCDSIILLEVSWSPQNWVPNSFDSLHRACKTKCADRLISTNRGRRNSSNHEPEGLIFTVAVENHAMSQVHPGPKSQGVIESTPSSRERWITNLHWFTMYNCCILYDQCLKKTSTSVFQSHAPKRESLFDPNCWSKPEASPSKAEGATCGNSRLRTLEAKTWASRPGKGLPFVQTLGIPGRILKIQDIKMDIQEALKPNWNASSEVSFITFIIS